MTDTVFTTQYGSVRIAPVLLRQKWRYVCTIPCGQTSDGKAYDIYEDDGEYVARAAEDAERGERTDGHIG